MNTNTVENNNTPTSEPVDLVEVITNLLIKHQHLRPEAWKSHLNPNALTEKDQNVQRFLINRAWRNILSELDTLKIENTMDIRYCLVDNGAIARWVELFEKQVIPCIIRQNLPLIAV